MKSIIKPPADGFSVNIHRNPNPFSSDEEPDWVCVSSTTRKDITDDEKAIAQRPPIPPGCELLDIVSTQSDIDGHLDAWGTKGTPLVARDMKTPPPIPRKPVSLSARESQHNTSTKKYAHYGQGAEQFLGDKDDDLKGRMAEAETKCDISSLQRGGLNSAASFPISRGPGSPVSDSTSQSHGGIRMQRAAGVEKNANDLLNDSVDESITWKPLLPQ